MIGMSMLARELEAGRRWVSVSRIMESGGFTGARHRELEDARIERIIDWDQNAVQLQHHVRVTIEDDAGNRRQVMLCRPDVHVEKGRRIIWTDPLPADDVVALDLVRGAYISRENRQSILLWVGAVTGDLAYCHLITDDRHHTDEDTLPAPDDCMTMHAKPRLFRLPEPCQVGQIIAVTSGGCEIEDGRYVHSPKVMHVVASDLSAAAAVASLPTVVWRKSDFASGNFRGGYDLDEAEARAWARTEPSEALVLVYQDGDRTETAALSKTGIAFHHQEDVEAYLEGQMPGPGLWAFTNAVMTAYEDHEGGWDQDLGGDVAPADDAIILRHFGSRDDLVSEIVGRTDETMNVEDLIRQAHAADGQENAAMLID